MPDLPDIERFESNSGARIYRLPCEAFPGFVAFAHLIFGQNGPILIDAGSGYGASTRQLLTGLEAVRERFGESFQIGDIGTVLITHGHIDHFGGLSSILEAIGPRDPPVEVGIHQLDRHVLTAYEERVIVATKSLRFFLQQAGVSPDLELALMELYGFSKKHVRGVPVSIELFDGLEMNGMRFIHVPGHCPGQVVIELGDVLLSADHILERTSPHLAPESITASTGLSHYRDSLLKVRNLPEHSLALGGHEGPIRDIRARIDAILAGHDRKLDRVLSALRDGGPATISGISAIMYPKVEGFHVLLALEEVGAHVEYLYQRGQLSVDNLDEVEREPNPPIRFRAT